MFRFSLFLPSTYKYIYSSNTKTIYWSEYNPIFSLTRHSIFHRVWPSIGRLLLATTPFYLLAYTCSNQLLVHHNVVYVAPKPMAEVIKGKHMERLFDKNTDLHKTCPTSVTVCV